MKKGTGDEGVVDPFDPATWAEEDEAYFDAIDAALKSRDKRYISNGHPKHAAFLVHRFLTHAVDVVRIYSGSLSRTLDGVDVYGNSHIVAVARDFLDRDGHIRVVVQNDVDLPSGENIEDHPFVSLVEGVQSKGSLVVKKAAGTRKDELPNYHWMVMDESAYRLETDVRNAKAHASFGAPRVAMQLAQLFDGILYEDGKTLFEWPRSPSDR